MSRNVLIRRGQASEVVAETHLPKEAVLHDVLTDHPELLPTEDLGFGRTMVVGKETSLEAGYADLVLIDETGQVGLVEVKKEGNPDVREVVAQLLDYASALWGMTLEDFEQGVLGPFLRRVGRPPTDLRSFLAESFPSVEAGEPQAEGDLDERLDRVEGNVGRNLGSGAFTLVVAAPVIPQGVRRVLDYLNARGIRVFGVEVSYFTREADGQMQEVFVPRVVVMPTRHVAVSRESRPPIALDSFMDSVSVEARPFVSSLMDGCQERGAHIVPHGTGASVVLKKGGREKSLVNLEAGRCDVWRVTASGFNGAPFEKLDQKLEALSIGSRRSTVWSIPFGEIRERASDLLVVIFTACEELLAD